MMRCFTLVLCFSISTATGIGCGGDDLARSSGAPDCVGVAKPQLTYDGHLDGEATVASLEFAPTLNVVLVGTFQTASADWRLRAAFRDGVGRGDLTHAVTGEVKDVRVRFLEEGIELQTPGRDWESFAPSLDDRPIAQDDC